jgi:hypothetical protein
MEVLEGADQDISSLKSFTVKFCISNRAYYEGPASTLLLEDWLRKELASLRECTTEEIDAHLDRALINGHLALGALDSVAINFGERFSVTVAPHKVIELHKPLSFRVFLEGPYFRAIQ